MIQKLITRTLATLLLAGSQTSFSAEPVKKDHSMVLQKLKDSLQFIDQKVVDPFIISTCTATGSTLGELCVTKGFSMYYGNSYTFKPEIRFEDNLGYLLGGSAGYAVGTHLVCLRHMVTDPLFQYGGQLLTTSLEALSTLTYSKAKKAGTYIEQSLKTRTLKLREYINTEKNK